MIIVNISQGDETVYRDSNTQGFDAKKSKGSIIPVHKKESKNVITNYRPISRLPIFGKIFEKVIYNNLFKYLQDNKNSFLIIKLIVFHN